MPKTQIFNVLEMELHLFCNEAIDIWIIYSMNRDVTFKLLYADRDKCESYKVYLYNIIAVFNFIKFHCTLFVHIMSSKARVNL